MLSFLSNVPVPDHQRLGVESAQTRAGMSMLTDLRFGVNVSTTAVVGSDPVDDARHAESLGYDFVSVNDHLHGRAPTHETWTLLACIAAATSRIRLATRVLALPYRAPAVLAKMAATLNQLSDDRLILGVGAGASDEEFRAYGLEVRTPGERIGALGEAVQIIRGLWTQPNYSFEGRYYRIINAELEPKPARPIPIWLGTFGPRGLSITGRLADGWIPSLGHASPQELVAMRERVVSAARATGRDPATLSFVYNLEVDIGEGAEERAGVVAGTATKVVEQLAAFVARGCNGFNFIPFPEPRVQLERLARDVIPDLRRQTRSA